MLNHSNTSNAATELASGSGIHGKGQINGTISEFNLKIDDFSSWIERFELYVLY